MSMNLNFLSPLSLARDFYLLGATSKLINKIRFLNMMVVM